MGSYIVYPSITYAQNAERMLSRYGIRAQIDRAPAQITGGSCSHALRIQGRDEARARQLLRSPNAPNGRMYQRTASGGYQEVRG